MPLEQPKEMQRPMPDAVVIPSVRAVARHALPNVIEGKIIPLLLFVGFLEALGTAWALVVALGWSLGSVVCRTVSGRRVPGIVLINTAALIAKTVVALATGSLFVYFLQPTVTTVVIGLAFLVSVAFGAPLAQRLAYDIFPFDEATKAHPLVRRFFVRLSVFWSFTSLINASITIWLLLSQTTTTFVMVKAALGPTTGIVTVGAMFAWFRWELARSDTELIWGGIEKHLRGTPATVHAG
jgi:hypothetical protein